MKTVNLDLILATAIGISVDELLFKNEVQIVRPSEALEAMCEACTQTLALAAEEQAKYYSELGFTSTGKKINDSILNLKQQII